MQVILMQARLLQQEEAVQDAHEAFKALRDVTSTDVQYDMLVGVVRHMLHPEPGYRATVEGLLKAQFFHEC